MRMRTNSTLGCHIESLMIKLDLNLKLFTINQKSFRFSCILYVFKSIGAVIIHNISRIHHFNNKFKGQSLFRIIISLLKIDVWIFRLEL